MVWDYTDTTLRANEEWQSRGETDKPPEIFRLHVMQREQPAYLVKDSNP